VTATTDRIAHLVDVHRLETIDVLGPTVQYLTSPEAGEPCVMRGTIPPGVVVPLHSHADPETFLMVSGRAEGLALSGEDVRWVPVGPGDVFHVPGNAKHAWRNPSHEPAVAIIVSTPKMGRFFRELAAAAGPRPEWPPSQETLHAFLDLADRYGCWNATPEENAAVGIAMPGGA
jgi:quercetin dioxygenase-like cupin family protein